MEVKLPDPIRFSPSGPDGWGGLPNQQLEHAELLKGMPIGLDHAYFSKPGLRSGIWRCGAYTERYDDYPVDEFMVVLEGEVTLTGDDGASDTYRKGDAFLLPKGFKGTWHQPGPMLKYYVIVG